MASRDNVEPKAQDYQIEDDQSSQEKGEIRLPQQEYEEPEVTVKTWVVTGALALSYGISYWTLPPLGTIGTELATKLGSPAEGVWISPSYSLGAVVAFMLCGANSDLFGRRWFIILGNLIVVVGSIVAGSAKSVTAVIAGESLVGFGAGNCQLSIFALPELLPNKWRHIGIVISEIGAFIAAVIGPACGRIAMNHGDAWRWIFYANAIGNGIAGVAIYLLYCPPKHPRGIAYKEAIRSLDYVGMVLFTAALTLFMMGIVYASYIKSSDAKVVATLVTGGVLMIIFALWESEIFVKLKIPLTPTHVFTHNRGRTFTAPFIVNMTASMNYLGPNVSWVLMVNMFFTSPTSPQSKALKLSVVQGLGILVGAVLLALFAGRIKHWKWQMIVSFTATTLFGALLGLSRPDRMELAIAFYALTAVFYAWAQYLATTYAQFGAEQIELGVVGGLTGVSRYCGALISSTVYVTILNNVVSSQVVKKVVPAVEAAGGSPNTAQALLAALPLGTDAVLAVKGATAAIIEAASKAYTDSYVVGIRTVCLSSLAFGGVGIIASLFLEDLQPKMTNTIEVYLENDIHADRNKLH